MKKTQTLTQVIIKTAAITFFIAFVCFSYGLTIFGFAFPRVMAGLCDNLGAYNAAAMYYEREYKASPSAEKLYLVLDRYILAQNHKKVVVYGDKFYDAPDCKNVIAAVNRNGIAEAGTNKLNRLAWGNEDNRLKCRITVALFKTGEADTALDKLTGWLNEGISNPDLLQPNYAYFMSDYFWVGATKVLFTEYVEKFEEEYNGGAFSGERVFALDFLVVSYAHLGDTAKAGDYAAEFNEWLTIL